MAKWIIMLNISTNDEIRRLQHTNELVGVHVCTQRTAHSTAKCQTLVATQPIMMLSIVWAPKNLFSAILATARAQITRRCSRSHTRTHQLRTCFIEHFIPDLVYFLRARTNRCFSPNHSSLLPTQITRLTFVFAIFRHNYSCLALCGICACLRVCVCMCVCEFVSFGFS